MPIARTGNAAWVVSTPRDSAGSLSTQRDTLLGRVEHNVDHGAGVAPGRVHPRGELERRTDELQDARLREQPAGFVHQHEPRDGVVAAPRLDVEERVLIHVAREQCVAIEEPELDVSVVGIDLALHTQRDMYVVSALRPSLDSETPRGVGDEEHLASQLEGRRAGAAQRSRRHVRLTGGPVVARGERADEDQSSEDALELLSDLLEPPVSLDAVSALGEGVAALLAPLLP